MNFEDFGLSSQLMQSIKKLGFTRPTEIQEGSIPYIIKGKDVVGESATGSGKTLAFGCGITEKAAPGAGLQALVLTPTRELAEQVKDSLAELSKDKRLRTTAVYGGVAIDPQIDAIRNSEVVVATPGRLLDHLERETISLSTVKILVLDEVDRMLDMGFIEDVEKIISQCPEDRQTMFFSATVSREILDLSSNYMKEPEEVFTMNQVDPAKLKQVYYDVPRNMKISLLVHLLKKEKTGLSMVFCNTRRTTEFVEKNLRANRVNVMAIHGGMTQNKRTKTIKMFNRKGPAVLVCTDVAARGLHIDNVSHIYNYEIPKDPRDYVHRIGRTARAGEEGMAVNLVSDSDHENFGRLLDHYRDFNIINMKKPYVERAATVRQDSRPRQGFGRKGPGDRGPGRRGHDRKGPGGRGPGNPGRNRRRF